MQRLMRWITNRHASQRRSVGRTYIDLHMRAFALHCSRRCATQNAPHPDELVVHSAAARHLVAADGARIVAIARSPFAATHLQTTDSMAGSAERGPKWLRFRGRPVDAPQLLWASLRPTSDPLKAMAGIIGDQVHDCSIRGLRAASDDLSSSGIASCELPMLWTVHGTRGRERQSHAWTA